MSSDIKSQRFWFDHDGHWFYEVRYKDQPNVPVVVHYHILPHVMTKTSGSGRVVAFDPGEPEALFYRIKQYYEEIRRQFYDKRSGQNLAP